MIERAGAPDRQPVRSIQREEPNAGNAVEMNIGAHIEFVKRASAGNRWQARGPNSPHRKRHHSDPGLAIEGVDRKLSRNYRTEHFRINRPVYEQELAPVLAH